MDTWGSRAVTAVLGLAGGVVVLGVAWWVADVARLRGPGGPQVALALVCAPIVVWLAATSEAPRLWRRGTGGTRRHEG
ncbi:hypothetical protein GCM10009623_00920 [Nocardioides aestuarii]|uniref:Uncharacterized protein n=1 Tax=Nocardioides aestuarii TaxID=252231 RepID=A0ABW4TJY0_9ACTN